MKYSKYKIILGIVFILLFYRIGNSQITNIEELRGLYPLRAETRSEGTVRAQNIIYPHDVSLYANHGTVNSGGSDVGFGMHPDTLFELEQGLDFEAQNAKKNGTGVHITLDKNPFDDLSLEKGFTISFWAKFDEPNKTISITTSQFMIEATDTELFFFYKQGESTRMEATYETVTNEWRLFLIGFNPTSNTLSITNYNRSVEQGQLYENILDSGEFDIAFENNHIFSDSNTEGGSLANVRFISEFITNGEIRNMVLTDQDNSTFYVQNPFSYYPLQESEGFGHESQLGRNGTSSSGISAATDRFGDNNAASFGTSGTMNLPDFFSWEDQTYELYESTQGFTVSFWVRIPTGLSSNDNGDDPFTNLSSNNFNEIFWGVDDSDLKLVGMQRRADLIGNNTYISNGSSKIDWFNWFYQPASFRDLDSATWFHVIYVQEEFATRVYMADMDGTMGCGCNDIVGLDAYLECMHTCKAHYDYYSAVDLSTVSNWGLGAKQGFAEELIDDFAIYRWPMNPLEVQSLHNKSIIPPSNAAASTSLKASTSKLESHTNFVDFFVYPNPTSGLLNVVGTEPTDIVRIFSITGRKLLETTNKTINISSFNSGLYIVSVAGKYGTFKVVKN